MPEPVDPNAWLTERFREFYRKNPVEPPSRFGRREYGFLFFGQKGFLRHLGFAQREDFQGFFTRKTPAHAYYSTAYYKEPAAPTMAEKGWLGAELIFDLDADHVPGSEKLPYAEQLAKVKDHFIRLVDEFILGDFGFSEKDLVLTFSGGRGYHAHVLAEAAQQLSAPERREIVDYITGTGLDTGLLVAEREVGKKGSGRYERAVMSLEIAPADEPGWGGRVNRTLVGYLTELKALPREEAVARLEQVPGVGAKRAQEGIQELARLDLDRIRSGRLDQGSVMRRIVPHLVATFVVPLAKGETDEPVTSDTKRLIRLPGSLHGKTGLRVVTLRRSEIEDFDPLEEAVAFGDEPVQLRFTKPLKFSLMGKAHDLKPNGVTSLPEPAAVFAVARGAASPL